MNSEYLNDFSVTSFIFSKHGKQLSNRRVLYHIEDRLKGYDANSILPKMVKAPISVALCPSSKCVRQCSFCSNTQRNRLNSSQNINYSERLFNEIMYDLKKMNVLGVSVAGGGEPLTYDATAMNNFFGQRDIKYKIGLHTNGVNLEQVFTKEILNTSNINYINVSVVANNKDLYKKITNENSEQFYKIERNILDGINKQKEYLNFPTLGVKILLCRENYLYIKDIYEYFKNLGISNILLRCVGNFEENQDVELQNNQIEELKTILSNQLNLNSNQIDGIIGLPVNDLPMPSRCWINILNYTSGIDPDGEVYLCSPWSRKEYSIGNVNISKFSDIWGSSRHRKIVSKLNNKLKKGKCTPLRCRHYYSNLAIDAYVAGLVNALPNSDIYNKYGIFI